MARKKMGAAGILAGRSGRQTLELVTGQHASQRAKIPESRFPEGEKRPPGSVPLEPVMYRVTPAQRRALVNEAVRRMEAAGRGKPDASEVLREVLEEWMAK